MSKSTTPTAAYRESNAPDDPSQAAIGAAYLQGTLFGNPVPAQKRGQNKGRTSARIKRPERRPIPDSPCIKSRPDNASNSLPQKKKNRHKRVDNIKLSAILEVFEVINVQPILTAIKPHYTTGRRGYDLKGLLFAHIARYILDVQYVAGRHLRHIRKGAQRVDLLSL